MEWGFALLSILSCRFPVLFRGFGRVVRDFQFYLADSSRQCICLHICNSSVFQFYLADSERIASLAYDLRDVGEFLSILSCRFQSLSQALASAGSSFNSILQIP